MKKRICTIIVALGLCLSVTSAIATTLDNKVDIKLPSTNSESLTLSTLDNNALFVIANDYTTELLTHVMVKPIDYGGVDMAISQAVNDTDNKLFNVATKQNQNFERMH